MLSVCRAAALRLTAAASPTPPRGVLPCGGGCGGGSGRGDKSSLAMPAANDCAAVCFSVRDTTTGGGGRARAPPLSLRSWRFVSSSPSGAAPARMSGSGNIRLEGRPAAPSKLPRANDGAKLSSTELYVTADCAGPTAVGRAATASRPPRAPPPKNHFASFVTDGRLEKTILVDQVTPGAHAGGAPPH